MMLPYEVVFPSSFHELNTPARGYLENVIVKLRDGREFAVTFLDEHNVQHHADDFVGQRVVVVVDVNEANMRHALGPISERDGWDEIPEFVAPKPT